MLCVVYGIEDGNGFQGYHGVGDVHTDTGLQTAVIGGFSTSQHMDTSTQLAWTCPTGNCTWSTYASLAVCSKCYDVSHLLISRITNGSMPLAYKDQGSSMVASFDPTTKLTQYTLPYANLTIDNWQSYRNVTPQKVNLLANDYMVAKSEKLPNNTANFRDYESLLMSFSTIKADARYMSNLSMWQDVRPAAMECGLFVCLQAYDTTVKSGKLFETVIATTRRKTPQSWHNTENMDSTNLAALGTLDWNPINNNGFLSRTDFQLDASDLNMSSTSANGTYNATQTLLYSMVDYLDGLLKTEGETDALELDYAVVYDKMTGTRKYTTPTVQSLFQSSDLNETFIGVANSMTSYFRNTGNRTRTGTVQLWTIHYRIRWPFLALPAFVVLGKQSQAPCSACMSLTRYRWCCSSHHLYLPNISKWYVGVEG